MLTFKKGNAYRAIKAIPMKGPTFSELPVGTYFVCVKGGKNPRLALESPEGGKFYAMAVPLTELQTCLEGALLSDVPDTLKRHLGLSTAETPASHNRFKKGDVARVATPFELGKTTIPTGTMMRCIKGGQSPVFVMRKPDGALVEVRMGTNAMSGLALADPVVDRSLMGVTHSIKTFPAKSEETLAMRGEITLPDGFRVDVSCNGHGDPVLFRGVNGQGRDAEEALMLRIRQALTDANMDVDAFVELDGLYANYLALAEGIETFAAYARHQQTMLEALSA
jgi:hypothetical protein